MNTPKHILIATGIYPPDIGGPAEYARQLFETILTQKYYVSVSTYGILRDFPTGIRHILYFLKLCIDSIDADYIITLDTFSVALPAVIFATIFGKKVVIRVGGDFLWESYVERTKEKILLSQFYMTPRQFSLKEKIIFSLTKFIFHNASRIIFSTEWQREIMSKPYDISPEHSMVIENFYPPVEVTPLMLPEKKVFLSPSRDIYIKNKEALRLAFEDVKSRHSDIELDTRVVSHEVLLEKISRAYAVIVPSLSEVSPNMVFDALQYGVPVVLTSDTGIRDRLKDLVVFVDPLSVPDMVQGLEKLLNPDIYEAYKRKIALTTYGHTWNEIAQEFIDLYSQL